MEELEAVGFDKYMLEVFGFTGSDGQIYSMPTYKKLWIAAQQAEREKWVRAVKRMEEEDSYKYLDDLLEMIDAPT